MSTEQPVAQAAEPAAGQPVKSKDQIVFLSAAEVQELHDEVNKLCALQKTLHHPGLAEAVARLAFTVVRLVPMPTMDNIPAAPEVAAAPEVKSETAEPVKVATNEPAAN